MRIEELEEKIRRGEFKGNCLLLANRYGEYAYESMEQCEQILDEIEQRMRYRLRSLLKVLCWSLVASAAEWGLVGFAGWRVALCLTVIQVAAVPLIAFASRSYEMVSSIRVDLAQLADLQFIIRTKPFDRVRSALQSNPYEKSNLQSHHHL